MDLRETSASVHGPSDNSAKVLRNEDRRNPTPAMSSPSHPLKRKLSLCGPGTYARQRPTRIPHPPSVSYPAFQCKRTTALRIAVHDRKQQLLRLSGNYGFFFGQNKLTLYYHDSQSKLSQQELGDLQKATHFDKKELQQWYKGTHTFQQDQLGASD